MIKNGVGSTDILAYGLAHPAETPYLAAWYKAEVTHDKLQDKDKVDYYYSFFHFYQQAVSN